MRLLCIQNVDIYIIFFFRMFAELFLFTSLFKFEKKKFLEILM